MPTRTNNAAPGLVQCPVCQARHSPVKGELTDGVYAADCQNCGHFFKFRAQGPVRSTFSMTVNGQSYTVDNSYPGSTSLNEFLREKGISPGTKVMCIEGGCGVCVVSATIMDPVTSKPRTYTVNSCCVPLLQCDGWDITTIEGLGNTRDGINPIQQRLADYNGTQCGFCSPGQVMSMYSLLKTNAKPTMEEVEEIMDDVVCRCTGYRSILDAMKSFSADAGPDLPGGLIDIEDLERKMCKKTGNPCTGKCSSDQSKTMLHMVTAGSQWLKPTNKQELCTLLNQHKADNYRLLHGNTGFGVYKDIGDWNYSVLIDLRGVVDFNVIQQGGTTLNLGANLTITNLLEYFRTKVAASNDRLTSFYSNIALHLEKIGTTSIRNLGTWAGNLMLKHKHPEFISDIYVIFEAMKTLLVIVDSTGKEMNYDIADFLKLDMTGKVITMAIIPVVTDANINIRSFKSMPRHQNAQAYVAAGFNMEVDASKNYLVGGNPVLAYAGISKTFTRATLTENYLSGKQLGDPNVLKGALTTLSSELVTDTVTSLSPGSYRQNVAISFFYKFVLDICSQIVNPRYLSGCTDLVRPLSSGKQVYDTDPSEYPVSKPMIKQNAVIQTCGEAEFINDTPPQINEVYAALVISTVGNADIDVIDPSPALAIPGVLKFISAKDIPAGGVNNCYPASASAAPEELFCSGKVTFAGQPLGLIVAEDQITADSAAEMVKVTYKNVLPPILTIDDAIRNNSFFTPITGLSAGDADGAIAKSAHQLTGQVSCTEQYHYHLETQISICYPTEDGMNILAGAQWINAVQRAVGQVLNVPASSITVEVKRIGGAFGAKITRNCPVSTACALAAHILKRPVRLMVNIHTNMKSLGKRMPCFARYTVGFTDAGLLNGVKIDYYNDFGMTCNDIASVVRMPGWLDNAYYCANWKMTPYLCKTNKPPNTACRSPGSTAAIFIMETIMEHVAKSLNKDQLDVRKLNLYQQGQKTPSGMVLEYCGIRSMVTQLETSAQIASRKQQIAMYNAANRWKKRGISFMPLKFALNWKGSQYNTLININNGDGSIAIFHGGVNLGQGINIKVAQTCAYELGVPMDIISVKKNSTMTNCNSHTTAGSVTSELCCLSVIECCKMLKERMAPIKAKMVNPTWKDLVIKSYNEGVDITARYVTEPENVSQYARYNEYGVCCSEVELDVLTGEHQILRVDILYDAGKSLNPDIDIGQAEGGFVMGVGRFLTERVIYDSTTGENLTSNTWEYHPPMPKDIPIDFRVEFLKNSNNVKGVLGSKSVGEAPVPMSISAFLAVKHAIEEARKEISKDVYFTLYGPATVDTVQLNCLTDITNLTYGN
ncbi:hypothetical protein SNE40_002166 [Patella caerulea]|uniref:FAD-binding PCMH-type domain-containing protein n=1 Tax=Patella caerulea TaxID=87958 RepID=A0AAN8KEX8_PATCE